MKTKNYELNYEAPAIDIKDNGEISPSIMGGWIDLPNGDPLDPDVEGDFSQDFWGDDPDFEDYIDECVCQMANKIAKEIQAHPFYKDKEVYVTDTHIPSEFLYKINLNYICCDG